jgi:hypothetical protein
MTRALLVVLVLLLSAPPLSAHAAEASPWGNTFRAKPLATHLGDKPARYMVVPAGGESPEFAQAEQALTAALRASGKASLVMNAQALGPVAQLADGEIVRRSANFPVDRVLILRLFPDGSGALTHAVVTHYDSAGKSLGSFSATAGKALTASTEPPQAEAATKPQRGAPPASPRPRAPRKGAPFAEALEQYEQRHIDFDEFAAFNASTGRVLNQWVVPYEGKYKKPLEGAAFYKKVGREDLVAAYHGKMGTKTVMGLLGGAAIVGGGLFTLTAILSEEQQCDPFSPDYSDCVTRNDGLFDDRMVKSLIGLGIAGGGSALMTASFSIDPNPVTPSEARELADGYNKRLKVELGLAEEEAPTEDPTRAPVIQARITPAIGPGGAGLVLSGTF